MELNPQKIRIIVRITREGEAERKILGLASVIFPIEIEGSVVDFEIHGFCIRPSKYSDGEGSSLWVTPPSYQGKLGVYHKMFYINNKEFWSKIENLIKEEYLELLDKRTFSGKKESFGASEEEIKPEELFPPQF